MTYVGLFDEVDLHEKVKDLKKLVKEKNSIIKLQDKEIDTLKGQLDLKELEIEMLKKEEWLDGLMLLVMETIMIGIDDTKGSLELM